MTTARESAGGGALPTGQRRINSVAPIRICDIGGWTDTWFAGHGKVFNIAVYPYVEAQLQTRRRQSGDRFNINLENYGDSYAVDPSNIVYEKHPLIEAAIDIMHIPEELAFDVNIFCSVPPGASTGTSAAVSVALIGALDHLAGGGLTAHEVAGLAHRVETEKLGLQSGIQDQLSSAYGGINYIEMQSFPHASVSPVRVPDAVWWELEQRLSLVYIGSPHSSSETHRRVISDLGDNARRDPRLEALRVCAERAKNAVRSGDFSALAAIMTENTEIQRTLHSGLVCGRFDDVMHIAGRYGPVGFKVNGAGGDGGSMTILTDGDMAKKRSMLAALRQEGYQSIDIYLARFGLRVW